MPQKEKNGTQTTKLENVLISLIEPFSTRRQDLYYILTNLDTFTININYTLSDGQKHRSF